MTGTALLVEDDGAIATVITAALEDDGFTVDRIRQTDRPEHVLALLLAARAQLGGESVEVLPVLGEVNLEHHVAARDLAAVNGEARLERLGVDERVRGLWLPERR